MDHLFSLLFFKKYFHFQIYSIFFFNHIICKLLFLMNQTPNYWKYLRLKQSLKINKILNKIDKILIIKKVLL